MTSSMEFAIIVEIIYQFSLCNSREQSVKICRIYHRFNDFGSWTLGKMTLDLLINYFVDNEGPFFYPVLVQNVYTHGCAIAKKATKVGKAFRVTRLGTFGTIIVAYIL